MKKKENKFQHILRKNLIFYRKQKGYTQEQLALEMNKKRTYINWLESGKANPTLEILLELAEQLEVEPGCLLTIL